jgi:dTDP-4-amino-4,6-dideoxygalactose transaminase
VAAAAAVLASGKVNYWTGEEGRAFEREFAASCEAPYAIAVSNGTVALEAANSRSKARPSSPVQ